ncbi:OpgC domain-containing protein [Pseudorhodoferax sp.]|uniref:OpgC domain-containing protein n=1 Tax=Pseudorhodoferax sp. TaxID=1993553 RepID=UPI002DD626FE|nr:OpgC domain-containing protein [Pseudorhodoferax sp.]
MSSASQRDSRIDFLRGFFILSMCVDHLGYLLQVIGNQAAAKVYTYQSLGWSSAAEFFVFFSGYVIATVYSRTLAARGFARTQLRGLHRSWELYVRNGLVFLLVLALVPWLFAGSTGLLQGTRLNLAEGHGAQVVLAFMRFDYFPTFLEVLPLYMVLMAVAPAFLWLQARLRWLPIALSAALWLAVQADPGLNFHTPGAWHFNPLAWQFVFFLGVWIAAELPLDRVDRAQRGRKLALALALLAACTLLKGLDKAGTVLPLVGALDIPGTGKTDMQPLRLLHFLLVLWLIALAMPSNDWVRGHALARGVARVGTHSLDCFCASIVGCYLLAGVFALSARGTPAYFALQAINVFGIVLLACWFQWLKTPPWRAPPAGPVRQPRDRDRAAETALGPGLSTAA